MHPRHLSLPFSLLNCRTIKYFSISKQKPYILRSLSLPPFLSLPFLILSIITEKMSINHYSSDHSQPQWWSPYMMDTSANSSSPNQKPSSFISTDSHFLHNSTAAGFCQLSSNHHLYRTTAGAMFRNPNGATFGFDLNNEDEEDEHQVAAADDGETAARESGEEEMEIPKERLFEKPLTPSDVGKLNRLVIPKQHAEKHFPLNGGAEPGDNGLLLGFEDEIGKSWRFRYSYWNSSQSYVLTKGWSRFVKEKRLDAGDIVVFARHRMDTGRLFIDWRRRNSGSVGIPDGGVSQPAAAVANGVGSGWSRLFYPSQYPYSSQHHQAGPSSLPYQPESLHAGTVAQQKQTTRAGSGNSKRLRLFGVNMECHHESEPSTPVGSPMSSQGQAHHPYHHQYYSNNHMVTHLF